MQKLRPGAANKASQADLEVRGHAQSGKQIPHHEDPERKLLPLPCSCPNPFNMASISYQTVPQGWTAYLPCPLCGLHVTDGHSMCCVTKNWKSPFHFMSFHY